MARVRINKMTVAELAAFCTVQRQGGSCPKDCALRKLGCSKFLPALWDIEAVRREEQREDAIDMVRHLIAAHGIYPEEVFPGLPEVEPPQEKRVPNRLKDAIGKEPSAAVPAVNLAEGELAQGRFTRPEHVKSEGVPGRGEAPTGEGSGGAVTTSPEEDEAADKSSAPVLAEGLAESECVWADETANEADKPSEQADRRAESMRQAEEILNAGKGKPSAPVRAVDVAKGNIAQANPAPCSACCEAGKRTRAEYVPMRNMSAPSCSPEHVKSEGVPGRGEAPAGEILNAGKKKPSKLDGFKPIAECKPVEPPKRRGRPPRKASE